MNKNVYFLKKFPSASIFKILFRFQANFFTDSDIALHIACRFDENAIVFNSKIGGDWGDEERHDLEIDDCENFEITVRAEGDSYVVSIQNIKLN